MADFSLHDGNPMQIEFPCSSTMYFIEGTWRIFFDGPYTQHGLGVGVIFVTPQGYKIHKAHRYFLPCTNEIVKYEALTNIN